MRGRRPPTGINRWTQRHLEWVKGVRFTDAAFSADSPDEPEGRRG